MKKSMRSSNTQYIGSFGAVQQVQDFLPTPAQLGEKQTGQKVTLLISKGTLQFFKSQAKQNNSSYQRMIRNLLDMYAATFSADK